MTEKKIPTAEQMKEYRQMCEKAILSGDETSISAFESEYDVFTKVFEEDGKKGVKDAVGGMLVPALFDGIACTFTDFFRGLAIPVVKGGKMALVSPDGQGTMLSDFEYENIYFSEGYYYLIKDGKQGLACLSGNIIVPAQMDKVNMPFNDLVSFEKDGKYGFAMMDMGVITDPVYDDSDMDSDNYLEVVKDGVKGYIDEEGNFTANKDERFFSTL